MELGFIVLCDKSEALNGKIYTVGGGWNVLRFPELPQDFGFSIAVGLDVSWDETNRQHDLELRVEDPDGQPLSPPFSFGLEAGRPPGAVQGQDQRFVLSLDTKQTFSAAGPHAVVVEANGTEVGRARFQVIRLQADKMRS